MTDTVTPTQADMIDRMTSRFLAWKLPEDFNTDAGISFKAEYNEHTGHPMRHEPTGTNLFSYAQAREMVRAMVAAEATQAAEIGRLLREVDRLKADNVAYSAQCKKLADRNRKLTGALEAQPPISVDAGTWWYPEGDTSSDACCHGPHEVVENTVDDMAEGDRRVIVIERALTLPDVYGLLHVFTEAEKEARDNDEPWALDLYATAEEATAALSTKPSEQEGGE